MGSEINILSNEKFSLSQSGAITSTLLLLLSRNPLTNTIKPIDEIPTPSIPYIIIFFNFLSQAISSLFNGMNNRIIA